MGKKEAGKGGGTSPPPPPPPARPRAPPVPLMAPPPGNLQSELVEHVVRSRGTNRWKTPGEVLLPAAPSPHCP